MIEELKQLYNNKKILKDIVSKNFPLTSFMDEKYGAMYCPFHDDKKGKKPSAKLYLDDEDNIERLYCFSENKQFTSYEYIIQVMHLDPLQYFLGNSSLDEDTIADLVEEIKYFENKKELKVVTKIKSLAIEHKGDMNAFFKAIYLSKIHG